MKIWYLLLLLLFFQSCKQQNEDHGSLINTNHLDHLYEEFIEDNEKIGSIWIYCEAPDYHWVTDEDEGYTCVDDVARSLVFYAREYQLTRTNLTADKIKTLTSFILSMQAENGFFFNFRFPNKAINKTHQNSVAEANWWSWRAFWALSEVALINDPTFSELKEKILSAQEKLLPSMMDICSIDSGVFETDGIETMTCIQDIGSDQVAMILIGLSNYYTLHPNPELKSQMQNLAQVLISKQIGDEETFPYFASLSWKNIWHAWGNSQAYALIKVGNQLNDKTISEAGIREVDYFIPYYIENRPSFFRLQKVDDSIKVVETSKFPQIAYNLRPMIYATLAAYELTENEKYIEQALKLGNWFLGENQANIQMYDPETGRTFDGIVSEIEVNQNSGAESTIEGLLSFQALKKNEQVWNALSEMLKE